MIHIYVDDVVDKANLSGLLRKEKIEHWVWKNANRISLCPSKNLTVVQLKHSEFLTVAGAEIVKCAFPEPSGSILTIHVNPQQ
jgi:hypothetical protein